MRANAQKGEKTKPTQRKCERKKLAHKSALFLYFWLSRDFTPNTKRVRAMASRANDKKRERSKTEEEEGCLGAEPVADEHEDEEVREEPLVLKRIRRVKKMGEPGEGAEAPAVPAIKTPLGRVFVAAKNMRGQWAEKPEGLKVEVVDVTSAQGKTSKNRVFSPMGLDTWTCPFTKDTYFNFEAWWQAGKVFKGVDPDKVIRFWKTIDRPRRRFKQSKGKGKGQTLEVLHSKWGDGPAMDWATSRRQVYVPNYEIRVRGLERMRELREGVLQGKNYVIFDFDGPRDKGVPMCEEVTVETLKRRIADTSAPFGHGWVVAALAAGIDHASYTASE